MRLPFRNKIINITVISILCFPLFINFNNILAKNKFCDIFIINNDNQRIRLRAEIADNDASRARGLMYRRKLLEDSGMLFVFEGETDLSFWMENTYIPLSIAYIDRHGIINEIYDMKPLNSSITYLSKKPGMFALEVNLGWFGKNNISAGSRMVMNGCIGK